MGRQWRWFVVSKQKSLKFRPQEYNRRRKLVWWREYREYPGELNWQENYSDKNFRHQGWPRVYKIGFHLHYLACHAPRSITKKWYSAWRRFYKKYKQF